MKNQIYKYIQMDVHKCKYIYFSNDFFQCSREDRESYPVGLEQSLIHSLHLSRSWVFLFRHEFNFPAAHRWGHRALQLPPSEKKKSAIIISSSFRASLTYVLSSVLFLFLNMICEGFFKNNVHWNIRFYVRSALNLGRSLHASLLWVWKKGDGRCACVFVAWGGGDFRNKDNWCVRSFPCQTQRRAKEEKFKSESTSEEKKKKGIAFCRDHLSNCYKVLKRVFISFTGEWGRHSYVMNQWSSPFQLEVSGISEMVSWCQRNSTVSSETPTRSLLLRGNLHLWE